MLKKIFILSLGLIGSAALSPYAFAMDALDEKEVPILPRKPKVVIVVSSKKPSDTRARRKLPKKPSVNTAPKAAPGAYLRLEHMGTLNRAAAPKPASEDSGVRYAPALRPEVPSNPEVKKLLKQRSRRQELFQRNK